MRDITFEIRNLPGTLLGLQATDRVLIDLDAAGHGWFVDPTPGDNEEFSAAAPSGGLRAASGPAAGGVDLLTALYHELGHALGFADLDPALTTGDVMSADLAAGTRRTPWSRAVDAVFAGS